MFFRRQQRHKVASFHLPTASIRWREILHCHKSLISNVRLEVWPFHVMRQAFGRRRKLVTFLVLHLPWLTVPHDCTRSRWKLRLRPTTRYLQRDLCQSGRVAVGTGYMWAESSRQSSLQFLAKHWSNHNQLEYGMQEGLYRGCIKMNLSRSFIPVRNHNFWSL